MGGKREGREKWIGGLGRDAECGGEGGVRGTWVEEGRDVKGGQERKGRGGKRGEGEGMEDMEVGKGKGRGRGNRMEIINPFFIIISLNA